MKLISVTRRYANIQTGSFYICVDADVCSVTHQCSDDVVLLIILGISFYLFFISTPRSFIPNTSWKLSLVIADGRVSMIRNVVLFADSGFCILVGTKWVFELTKS